MFFLKKKDFETKALKRANFFCSLNCIIPDRKNILSGLLAKQFSVCQNCFQSALGIVSDKKLFFRHPDFFPRWTYSQQFQGFVSKSLVWCVKTTFYVSKEALFWRRTFFGKTDSFLFTFGPWTKTSSTFGKCGIVAKFGIGVFLTKIGQMLWYFSDFKRKTLGSWQKFFGCVV